MAYNYLNKVGLTNLWGNIKAYITSKLSSKAEDNSVVHLTGNETIEGVKTFTGSPFVSNYAVTNGYFTKINLIARNEVPSQIHHSAFRVFDKNAKTLGEYCVEKSTSGSSLLHMDVHTDDAEGNDIMESVYLNLSNDGSTVSFHPAKDNRTDLGMSHCKWAKIYSDDVVHTSGNETIDGIKYFTSGPQVTNNQTTMGYVIKRTDYIRGTAPTKVLHNTFRVFDSVGNIVGECCTEILNTGENRLNLNIRNTNSNGKQVSSSLLFTINAEADINNFYPSRNGVINLGLSDYKWANVYATTFNGNLVGNVTGTADKATQDSDGNQINTTYSKVGHTHDDRYYTETEVNNLLSGKANTSGTYSSLTVGNATKATQDGNGNVITSTYQTKLSTAQLAAVNSGVTSTKVTTYDAYAAAIGTKANNSAVVHLTGNETINGTKTFSDVKFNISAADIAAIIV